MTHSINVILEDVRSALNVGAIFRTSDAAGVEELILAGITPYPPHSKIPKTALGAIETVNWSRFKTNHEAITHATRDGRPLISIELTDNAISYFEYSFPKTCSIIMGNEITGVSDYALEKSSTVIKIPMYGQKESLNVATSFGIIIYEILRQIHNG